MYMYQTLKTMCNQLPKHIECRQTFIAVHHIFKSQCLVITMKHILLCLIHVYYFKNIQKTTNSHKLNEELLPWFLVGSD